MDCGLSFRHAIERRRLVVPGESVLIAVSGGIDSMVLLDLFLTIRDRWGLGLAAAHVNHGLRGTMADRDEALVAKAAAQAGIAFFSARWHREGDGNMHDQARAFRRAFFEETAVGCDARIIALGHHRDDQAETVLMHLMRGAGLKGLTGMNWSENIGGGHAVIRPLLGTSRRLIEEHATCHGVSYAHDASNDSCAYTRNAVRHRLMPLMREFNPAIVDALSGLAERIRDDDEALSFLAGGFIKAHVEAREDGSIECLRSALIELQPAIRKRVLRAAFERAAGSMGGLQADHLSRMESIALGDADRACYDLPGPYRFERKFNRLFIVKKPHDHASAADVALSTMME